MNAKPHKTPWGLAGILLWRDNLEVKLCPDLLGEPLHLFDNNCWNKPAIAAENGCVRAAVLAQTEAVLCGAPVHNGKGKTVSAALMVYVESCWYALGTLY